MTANQTKQNPRDLGPLPEGIDAGALHAHARAECCDYERDGCVWDHKCLLSQGRRCKHYEESVLPARSALHSDYVARLGTSELLTAHEEDRLDALVAATELLLRQASWVGMDGIQEQSRMNRRMIERLWPHVIKALDLRRHRRGKKLWRRGGP